MDHHPDVGVRCDPAFSGDAHHAGRCGGAPEGRDPEFGRGDFTLDGAPLDPELTAPPYAVSWDTSTAAAGAHELGAVARDAAGNIAASAVTITVASGDTTAPAISTVMVSGVTAGSGTVSWITDEASGSRVEYGPTAAYGFVASSAVLVTSHVQGLTGLSPSTLYHYRALSQDAAGNLAASDDSTFMTLPLVSVTITTPSPAHKTADTPRSPPRRGRRPSGIFRRAERLSA